MLPVLNTSSAQYVKIESIYSGDMIVFTDSTISQKLRTWCLQCLQENFGPTFDLNKPLGLSKADFVAKATQTKKQFTNSYLTKSLLEDLIYQRYEHYVVHEIYYDYPRVRIIPPSSFLNSGISYNYRPHRDTWYGASQRQINHWISVENVNKFSTFFIAPSFFDEVVNNSSEIFDLDEWDKIHRPLASINTIKEDRPHPVPQSEIPSESKNAMALEKGQEVCFSGHHLHGSLDNTTDKVRISIDFRVELPSVNCQPPANIDNKSSGNYLKYMIKHPSFNI